MKCLVQIVPYLPPSISGVGDYALILARVLRDNRGWLTTFIVAHPNEDQTEIDGFPVVALRRCAATELVDALSSSSRVLLQYVGYGFQKRGCPMWLLIGLERWKQLNSSNKLVVMFHELYASGPPWRSSFWTHFLQKLICNRLAKLSDAAASNRRSSCQKLQKISSAVVVYLPIFSNVGEPFVIPDLESRQPILALFGNKSWRELAVTRDFHEFKIACKSLNIKEIYEIGPGEVDRINLPEIKWTTFGLLPPNEVSELLLKCIAGYISYPTDCIGKSGIVAAYQAHGLKVLIPKRCLKIDTDGWVMGRDFYIADNPINIYIDPLIYQQRHSFIHAEFFSIKLESV